MPWKEKRRQVRETVRIKRLETSLRENFLSLNTYIQPAWLAGLASERYSPFAFTVQPLAFTASPPKQKHSRAKSCHLSRLTHILPRKRHFFTIATGSPLAHFCNRPLFHVLPEPTEIKHQHFQTTKSYVRNVHCVANVVLQTQLNL